MSDKELGHLCDVNDYHRFPDGTKYFPFDIVQAREEALQKRNSVLEDLLREALPLIGWTGEFPKFKEEIRKTLGDSCG